jgi:hypothetical protein
VDHITDFLAAERSRLRGDRQQRDVENTAAATPAQDAAGRSRGEGEEEGAGGEDHDTLADYQRKYQPADASEGVGAGEGWALQALGLEESLQQVEGAAGGPLGAV